MNVIGNSTNWGFAGGDIWSQVMLIVGSLAGFLLVGLAVRFTPSVIIIMRAAVFYREQTGKGLGVRGFVEEVIANESNRRDDRRNYRR